jgi:hypothetical protein
MPLTHLRLVISASELSLIPFELALAPSGFPGAGQSLLLQSQHPLCLTRETRRVAEQGIEWPKAPKILFVAAAPPEVGPIPVEAHLLALRKLIDRWWVTRRTMPSTKRKSRNRSSSCRMRRRRRSRPSARRAVTRTCTSSPTARNTWKATMFVTASRCTTRPILTVQPTSSAANG